MSYARYNGITGGGDGTGTVTSLSVVSANGFAGTVASPNTTPAITLSTTITGILQGNGTAISAATTGNLTDVGTDGIVITGGTGAVLGSGTSIAQHVADSTHNGYLSSADWTTFNSKQTAGNYITALTGDATAAGPGSVALTLATVNANVGSFAISTVTVNAKGLVTAASAASTTGSGNVVLSASPTLTGTITAAAANFSGALSASNLSGTNTGDVSLAAVGSAPSANGASLSGQIITLQPADGTRPGLITAGAQTIGGAKTFSAAISASNLSGTNTGDQTITLTSDVTGSGAGSFATTIAAGAVTLAKMANLAANSIIGNNTGSSATPIALTTTQTRTLIGLAPTKTKLTSTGTTAGYVFTISTSTTCAVGDTYTNNSNTYTVIAALSAQTGKVLFMSGASAPQASGTLSRATGSGTSSVTFSANQALATYAAPANVLYLRVKGVGAGGGGSGGGTASAAVGTAGTDSLFGANVLKALGGLGGPVGGTAVAGGAGGSASSSSANDLVVTGQSGGGSFTSTVANTVVALAGCGGQSIFGGAGASANAAVGGSASTNSGSGGAGGGDGNSASNNTGTGGGSGGAVLDALITTIPALIYYAVGAKGTGGAGGTNGSNGGDGGDGAWEIWEHYL